MTWFCAHTYRRGFWFRINRRGLDFQIDRKPSFSERRGLAKVYRIGRLAMEVLR